jgi:hypothetical protein
MTMACSPDPGTAAAAWDHPPCDVAVYTTDIFPLPKELVSLTDNLRRAGMRVEDDELLTPWFARDPTPARVNVIILSKRNIPSFLLLSSWRSFETVMRSGVPVIPVYWDVGPDELQDELERTDCLLRAHGLPMGSSCSGDFCRRLLTISGHDLARYDG